MEEHLLGYMDKINHLKDVFQVMKEMPSRVSRIIEIKDLRDYIKQEITDIEDYMLISGKIVTREIYESFIMLHNEINDYIQKEYSEGLKEGSL